MSWLYQPIPAGAEQEGAAAPSVFPDSYINEWRPPTRRPFATALIVAAATISPWALTQPEATTVDRYYQALSEPVRQKPGLSTPNQSVLAWDTFTPAAVQVVYDWIPAWSEPVRDKPRAQQQQALAWDTFTPTPVQVIYDWIPAWPEPVRFRQYQTALQSFIASDLRPIVSFSWYGSLSEPRRDKLKAQQQQALAFNVQPVVSFSWFNWLNEPPKPKKNLIEGSEQSFAVDVEPAVSFGWFNHLHDPVRFRRLHVSYRQSHIWDIRPVVSFGWFESLSEPKRFKLPLPTGAAPAWIGPFNPTVSFGWSWLEQPGPVRFKPGLGAHQQQSFTVDWELFPAVNELMPWYGWLSEPTRDLKVGLSARLQMTLAIPERILPTPNVRVTLDATETDGDIFSAGADVYQPVNTAVVSIEEIEVPGNAAMSIREP